MLRDWRGKARHPPNIGYLNWPTSSSMVEMNGKRDKTVEAAPRTVSSITNMKVLASSSESSEGIAVLQLLH